MCGIAGLFSFNDAAPSGGDLERMLATIVHRGPDDEGTFHDGPLAMGMRRLSIIDLSSGHQPIHNEDRTVWVVFNGEIYNYRELREDLLQKGHRFYTSSDTEVLVHLYEEYGEEFVSRLNGMFGIALWDARARKLLLVRDRVGEKQLFYATRDGQLVFGSELKCVLAASGTSREIDPLAIDDYFTFLYCPAQRTIYRQISELPPATMLIADASGIRTRKYWQLTFAEPVACSDDEYVASFRAKFRDSVRSRMVSDVPIGALLSGGVDSSAVVAEMANAGGKVSTFCIGYEGDAAYYDERRFAAIVARKFSTQHHELVVAPDLRAIIDELIVSFDQPFADSSAIANYYVFKETRKHVKVVLTGLGGDEVAAGYERYLGLALHNRYRSLPSWLRNGVVARLARALPDPKSGNRSVERLKRFVAQGNESAANAYLNYLSSFDQQGRGSLFTAEFRARLGDHDSGADIRRTFDDPGAKDLVDKALRVDSENYLVGDLLTLTDRMSMRSSIEARAPFVDYELMEMMARVPSRLKLRGLSKKYILKKAYEGILPREILHRSKRGFTLPLTLWLRRELNGWMRSVLAKERIERTGCLESSHVQRLVEEHSSGRENHHARLWALLMFVHWHERFQQ